MGIAEAAGELLLAYRERVLAVATKESATDPVSEADEASQELILERLAGARPDDGVVAEEQDVDRGGSSGVRWVVDPLDGTVNYLYGIPQWCVSIAARDDDGLVAGVVHDPSRGETFRAARGGGAWLGGDRLAVNEPGALSAALVATGFADDPDLRAAQGRLVADLLTRVRDIRRAGAAALDLAWLAAGRVDGYYELGLQPWDWAAGRLLVTEAGGTVSDVRGRLAGAERPGLVAGEPAVQGPLDEWLRGWLA